MSASYLCLHLEEVGVFETAAPQGRGQTAAEETEISLGWKKRVSSGALQCPPWGISPITKDSNGL